MSTELPRPRRDHPVTLFRLGSIWLLVAAVGHTCPGSALPSATCSASRFPSCSPAWAGIGARARGRRLQRRLGLGILGAAACSPDELRQWIARTRKLTDKPFGVDTLLPASVQRESYKKGKGPSPQERLPELLAFAREFMEKEGLAAPPPSPAAGRLGSFTKDFFAAQMEVVVEERVPVYASGLGDPAPWMERMRRNGTGRNWAV